MKIKFLLGTILTVTLFTTANAQTVDKAKLDQFFDRIAEKNKGMGSIAIIRDGNPVYTRAFGYSQISDTGKKSMTTANRFRIGSVTKTFTAALILQLVDEKKLKLTETLDKFLPQIPNANKITIEQILSHRSGIPNVNREQNAEGNINTLPMTKEDHLALIVNTKPDFEPGTKSIYSNSGYFVLGLIIEKLTGKSYENVLQEKITKKAGLRDTYVATGNIDLSKNEALTYFMLPGASWKQVRETHPSLLFSAGAIVSTPNDLAKFIQALFNGKIISKESLDLMKTLRDGEGFGMVTFPFAGKTFYGHTGGADNYGAWMMYLPEEKLAIAYTSNAKIYPVKDIISGVVDIYYNKPFEIPTFESIAVSPELLDKYIGVYALTENPARKWTITRKGDTLYAQPPGSQNGVPLEATAQGKFKIDNGTATGIAFEFDVDKSQMTIKRGDEERVFIREK
jgi:D-alanyl-D-alanine carboxypeptidase